MSISLGFEIHTYEEFFNLLVKNVLYNETDLKNMIKNHININYLNNYLYELSKKGKLQIIFYDDIIPFVDIKYNDEIMTQILGNQYTLTYNNDFEYYVWEKSNRRFIEIYSLEKPEGSILIDFDMCDLLKNLNDFLLENNRIDNLFENITLLNLD